jgi:HEPN domain-containing protein
MNEKVQYWLALADYDLETARVMLEGRRFLYVGFMCHQVIEKVLKEHCVLAKNENPPHTHNLNYLAEQSGIYGKMTEEFKGIMDIIELLNVEARYPTHKEKLMQTLTQQVQ